MNCTVGFVICFCEFPSLSWQHGTRQQGWYISGTQREHSLNLTVQFILSLSMSIDGMMACPLSAPKESSLNHDIAIREDRERETRIWDGGTGTKFYALSCLKNNSVYYVVHLVSPVDAFLNTSLERFQGNIRMDCGDISGFRRNKEVGVISLNVSLLSFSEFFAGLALLLIFG